MDKNSRPSREASRAYFEAAAAAAMEGAPLPERPRNTFPRAARRRQTAAELAAVRREKFEARCARAQHARGEPIRPPPRTPPKVWELVRAITRDTSGSVAPSALSVLPLELRARARAALEGHDMRHPTTRYRVALLVALSELAGARRVVSGFCRESLCGLLRSPLTGDALSLSRVFNRAINAGPILAWLIDEELVEVRQPALDEPGVPRGPSRPDCPEGYALNLYSFAELLDATPRAELVEELVEELELEELVEELVEEPDD